MPTNENVRMSLNFLILCESLCWHVDVKQKTFMSRRKRLELFTIKTQSKRLHHAQ